MTARGARRKKSTVRESALVAAIVEALRATPGLVIRKRHGTAWGFAGDPDLTGCYLGRHFELEVKTPAGALTRLQEARLAEWARAGAITSVVRSVDEALAALGITEDAQG
jgi:hypothetical protein